MTRKSTTVSRPRIRGYAVLLDDDSTYRTCLDCTGPIDELLDGTPIDEYGNEAHPIRHTFECDDCGQDA